MQHRIIFVAILVIIQLALGLAPGARRSDAGEQPPAASFAFVLAQNSAPPPSLMISPREVDLGSIGPGQSAEGRFILKGGAEPLPWSTRGPEGWLLSEQQELTAAVEGGGGQLLLRLRVLAVEEPKSSSYPVRIDLEAGAQSMPCTKELQPGTHRETIRLVSPNGTRTVFFKFKLIRPESEPLLAVAPLRIDLGRINAGQPVSKVIKVTNRGKNSLKWIVDLSKEGISDAGPFASGRYVSFLNEGAKESGVYVTPAHVKDSVELSGGWPDKNGYPFAESDNSVLKYRFSGTGIVVLFWKGPGGGNLVAFIDDKFAGAENCNSEHEEEAEYLVADDLPAGSHTLTITAKDGGVMLEGMRIFGVPVLKGSPGWISFFPNSGVTTRETDYVNIVVNAEQLKPAFYGERVLFKSNGGEGVVEISFEIAEESATKILDVYRYARRSDYLYTTAPQTEAKGLIGQGYVKEGIAFRLFSPGTPGTTEFYRWYNAARGDHYYSHDPSAGRALNGYAFEGSIGNIATSKLTGTRELYRWFNPRLGSHFYTTDPAAQGKAKKGYRFEAIAGYVK